MLNLKTKEDICKILGEKVTVKILKYYTIKEKNKYVSEFKIPKKNGGTRTIVVPTDNFMFMQKQLLKPLENLYLSRYGESMYLKSVHGFLTGKSIITNAENHINKKYILNIDLKDFFPSINFGRVRGIFLKKYNFNTEVSTVLAQIVTINGKLAQGSPTSPIISNMICYDMDKYIYKLCLNHNCNYTRYADDITISSNEKYLNNNLEEFKNKLYKIINKSGFENNSKKVRFRNYNSRQEVTGIIVNKKANVSKEYIKQLRLLIYKYKNEGPTKTAKNYCTLNNIKPKKNCSDEEYDRYIKSVILGKISFLGQVVGRSSDKYLKYLKSFDHKKWSDIRYLSKVFDINDIEKVELENFILDKIKEGESKTIEFKKEYNKKMNKKIKETILAFNNTYGGHIFIGVEDSKTICGIPDKDSDKTKQSIDSMIDDNFKGMDNIETYVATVKNKEIIIIQIGFNEKIKYNDQGKIPVRELASNRIKPMEYEKSYNDRRIEIAKKQKQC